MGMAFQVWLLHSNNGVEVYLNIFNSKLICIKTGSTISQAKSVMHERRIRHLPVIDDDNQILSVLSKSDMTDVLKFADMPVDLFASSPVKWVDMDTPLWRVANIMLENKISSVLLCDSEKRAVGIITTDDLLFQFSQLLREKENPGLGGWNMLNTMTTAGTFFNKLADIGI
jgi:acetoin utilization protein AcuB